MNTLQVFVPLLQGSIILALTFTAGQYRSTAGTLHVCLYADPNQVLRHVSHSGPYQSSFARIRPRGA